MKFFTETKIVEIEKGTKLEPMTPELRESLKSLQYQPAFQYILSRLRFQRARVQQHLNNDAEGKSVPFAQAGIFWLGWIESDINATTRTPVSKPRDLSEAELEEFNKIASNLEIVGAN